MTLTKEQEWRRTEWQPISTAPKDGSRVELLGENGKLDAGSWYYYSEHVDDKYRKENEIPDDELGEFSTDNGEGPHTHWRHQAREQK